MALRLAIDVNRYADFMRGDDQAVAAVREASDVHLPFITLAELRAGFRRGNRQDQNERALAHFISSNRVTVLFADEGTTHVYVELHTELRRRGTPIPINDLWIAALCVQHGLVLFTRDNHFDVVPRLALLKGR